MTRPSEHAHDWAVCSPVQPDVDEAPTGYRLQHLPIAITEEGAIDTPPPTVTLLAATPGQRDTRTVITATANDVGEGTTYTNVVTVGNRALEPLRWEITVTDTDTEEELATLDFLCEGSESRSGNGFGALERRFERWDDEEVALHVNPTYGGAGHTGHEAEPETPMRSYGGAPLCYRITGSNPTYVFESAQHPMDFGGDNENDGFSNHASSDDTHPLLHWRDRMSLRLDLHYQGDPAIHRATHWFYVPDEWNNEGVSDPFLGYYGPAMSFVGYTFTNAYIVNLTNGVETEIADFAPPNNEADFIHTWDISKNRYVKDGGTLLANPGPVTQGYVGIILRDSVSGISIGLAGKLSDTDDEPNIFTALEPTSPNYVTVHQVQFEDGTADPETNNTTAVNFFGKSHNKRRAGWVGSQIFVMTGRHADVQNAMTRLYAVGWLDNDPPEPPPEAQDGTTFPTPEAPFEPALQDAPALVGCGQSQMAVGFSAWFRTELDPDLGKCAAADPLDHNNPISTLDPLKVVWNDSERRFECIDIFTNASGGNWGNSAPNTFGPQLSLMHAFKARHGEAWCLWFPFSGSTMNNANPLTGGSWAAGIVPVQLTIAATIAPTSSTTATITASSGTPFAAAVPGAAVRISGSADGYLDFVGGGNEHPLIDYVDAADLGGNNTHVGRPLTIIGIGGGGASVVVSLISNTVQYVCAAETATFTFDYGPVNLRSLAEESIDRAVAFATAKLRRTLAPKLTVTIQGESDKGRTELQYTTDLVSHIDWMRDALGIDMVSEQVPHGVVELTPHSPGGTDAQVLAIITAQRAAPDLLDHVFTVDTAPLKLRWEGGTYPPVTRNDNGTHWTCSALVRLGIMVDERYATYDQTPPIDPVDPVPPGAGGDPQDPVDPYPGNNDPGGGTGGGGSGGGTGMSFVVEDGTGLENAESYATVEFASDYFGDYGASAEWTDANVTVRQQALRVATERLDQLYVERLKGYQLRPGTQALEIPRTMAYGRASNLIEGVPVEVQRATCELARRWLINPDDLLPDEAAGSNVQSDSVSVGPIHVQSQFSGQRTTAKRFPVVDKYMVQSGLVRTGGFSVA